MNVLTQNTFREAIVFLYNGNNNPLFIFDNFTSNDTSCSVVKHTIAFESSTSNYIPQFTFIEGHNQF